MRWESARLGNDATQACVSISSKAVVSVVYEVGVTRLGNNATQACVSITSKAVVSVVYEVGVSKAGSSRWDGIYPGFPFYPMKQR